MIIDPRYKPYAKDGQAEMNAEAGRDGSELDEAGAYKAMLDGP
jgi:hypothetical protein